MMLNWIISSSLLIVAVIVLRFALRGRVSPAIGYALWLVVLVRLLMPFSVMHVPYSAASLVESTQLSQDLERLEQVTSVEHKSDGEIIGYVEGFFHLDGTPNNGVHTQIAENADEEEFARWQRSSNVKNFGENILRPAWIAGIVLVAAWFLVINAIFTHRLRRTRQKMELDCPRPVYISEAVETPCLHGLLSPAIYVTPAVAADEVALRHVLSHELSHYRHRDHIWGIFRAAVLALHWYNPLVWWAAALSRRDAELTCDESAIALLGEEQRTDYGRTLIGLSCRGGGRDLLLNATTMTGSKRGLRERIVLIAEKPQTKAAAVFFAAVILIFAAVFTFAGSLPMGESYIRNSTARNRAPAWRFDLTDEITTVHLYDKYYKDEEFYAQGEERFDAALLRGLSYDIIGWEETSEGTVFRIDKQYHGNPDWEQFLLGGGLNLSGDGWSKVDFNVMFGEEFTARYCTWSWLQLQKPQTIQKGDTITLFNIGIYEEPHYAAGDGEYKDTAKARIIYELYFE